MVGVCWNWEVYNDVLYDIFKAIIAQAVVVFLTTEDWTVQLILSPFFSALSSQGPTVFAEKFDNFRGESGKFRR